MAYVISAGTSIPRCHVDQKEAAVFAREMFKDSFKDIDRLLSAFQNGEIASRQFVMPLDWYKEAKSFKEKNQTYIDMAVRHSAEAVSNCLSDDRFLKKKSLAEKLTRFFYFLYRHLDSQH